jgi:hypothetical protein
VEPKVRTYETPTEEEQHEFARKLYFGSGGPLESATARAYQDFCRTAHGIGKYKGARELAEARIQEALRRQSNLRDSVTDEEFDQWHEDLCREVREISRDCGFELSVGQIQKWVNMTFKYLFVFGEKSAPGFAKFYRHCHIPIDNIILRRPEFAELDNFGCAWSRISDYGAYLNFQKKVRECFAPSSPLAVEFRLWKAPDDK